MARNKPRESRAAPRNNNQAGIHAWLPIPLRRAGYRVAYVVLRVWWLLRRPQVSGVKCVLTHGERVLLVRHTYGRRGWDLPGGTVKRRESPEAAASREIIEELGIEIDDWSPLGLFSGRSEHRRDELHCFQAAVATEDLEIDLGELAAASWFPQQSLPHDLGRWARRILATQRYLTPN